MVKDEKVQASIFLHAVLRNLEELCAIDDRAGRLIAGTNVAIRFSVPQIRSLVLSFKDGHCAVHDEPGAAYNMNPRFSGPRHFNQMIEGTKMPLPTRGFQHLGFLKNSFPKLADWLTEYLKPNPVRLEQDAEFRRNSTILTAYTAFYALAEIARLDSRGQANAARIPDGNISVLIGDVPLYLVAEKALLSVHKGPAEKPDAAMIFDTVDTACGILSGRLDSYACIGNGRLAVRGVIPMIDNLNKLLSQVPAYLG